MFIFFFNCHMKTGRIIAEHLNCVGHVSLPGVARICYGRPRGGATARVVSELGQVQPRRGGYVSRVRGGLMGTHCHTCWGWCRGDTSTHTQETI